MLKEDKSKKKKKSLMNRDLSGVEASEMQIERETFMISES